MTFEWDDNKAVSNFIKHGVLFDEAVYVFDDPYMVMVADDKHSEVESREWIIGETIQKNILLVVFARRNQVTRVISARKASRKERKQYEENKNGR
ncbi:BrnT family toxin [bacterium]|nr:BrnT family toxin [bacterium]